MSSLSSFPAVVFWVENPWSRSVLRIEFMYVKLDLNLYQTCCLLCFCSNNSSMFQERQARTVTRVTNLEIPADLAYILTSTDCEYFGDDITCNNRSGIQTSSHTASVFCFIKTCYFFANYSSITLSFCILKIVFPFLLK